MYAYIRRGEKRTHRDSFSFFSLRAFHHQLREIRFFSFFPCSLPPYACISLSIRENEYTDTYNFRSLHEQYCSTCASQSGSPPPPPSPPSPRPPFALLTSPSISLSPAPTNSSNSQRILPHGVNKEAPQSQERERDVCTRIQRDERVCALTICIFRVSDREREGDRVVCGRMVK